MTTADFYGRKSTKDDGRSVAGQETEYRDDCASEGLTVGRIFADSDRSASRYATKARPDYEALLEHIRSGNCQLLSLWESSRGSRDLGDWVAFLDLCRNRGVKIRIISHGRTYDARVRRDWRTLADEGVDSADESEKISERVRRGKRLAAKEGRPTSRLAYGFRRIYDDRGKFEKQVEHPVQAGIVREIIESIAAGTTAGKIAKLLNTRGIPTPRRVCPAKCEQDHQHFFGGLWTDKQVRQIAIAPAYAGERVHQGEVVGKGDWQPIVDPDVWRKAHAILTSPGRKPLNDSRLAHWLVGAVACGLCDATLGTGNRPPAIRSYQCRKCFKVSASARGLEGFLEPLIVGRLAQPDTTDLFAPKSDDVAVRAAATELEKLQARLDEFRAEWAKPNGLSAAAVAEAERGLMPQIETARAKLRRLTVPPVLSDLDGVNVASEWHSFGPHIRRELVRAVAELVLTQGSRNGVKTFDKWRLAGSHWVGDDRTWGQVWEAAA